MWLSQVLHPPNCVGKYFLRRVPYRPITLLYQGTAGQSPQGFPPICPASLKTCPSRLFLHIRYLLADCRTVVCFFVISCFHYSHRDCLPIEFQDFVCALLPSPQNYPEDQPEDQPIAQLQHLGVATYLRPPFSALRLKPPKRDRGGCILQWALRPHYLPIRQPRASETQPFKSSSRISIPHPEITSSALPRKPNS